ncbi:MAG: CsbD family protein [Armatimonadetes bacterium]|nr:CsbD family protein [Armatimonadota bacterium]
MADIKKAVDGVAGAGTSDKIEGKVDEWTGKAKQAVGDLTDDDKLHAEGEAQEAEGKLSHAIGEIKEVAGLVAGVAVESAHIVADKVKHAIHKDDK